VTVKLDRDCGFADYCALLLTILLTLPLLTLWLTIWLTILLTILLTPYQAISHYE
jgi:hypothetical protein